MNTRTLLIVTAIAALIFFGGRKAVDTVKRLIVGEEGLRLKVYRDPGAGAWTIGYGHKVQPGEPYHPYGPVTEITLEEANRLFDQDTRTATAAVTNYVKVPLTENQRAALISFVYNIGTGAFYGSTMLRRLNSGDYAGAAAEFARWNKDDGKVVPILTARRERERVIFSA